MSKCEFFKEEIVYLGHLVSGQSIYVMKQKIKAVTDFAPATNLTEAQHIIGLIGYYKILSNTIRSLNKLTRKNVPYRWTEQCQRSLDYIKQVITANPIFIYPDPNKQYYLFTDSSIYSWSGI